MKVEVLINLSQVEDAKHFCQEIRGICSDVDLVRDRQVIDAKSILGIFSLDLSKPVTVVLHSEDQDEINKFMGICARYAADV